jgi:phosphoribosyl-ATP pyrophosphohydrolase/phosphoribosyl-AMP cyclohydrolase
MIDTSRLNFDKGNGLVTVVTQDAASGTVLMVAHADRDAIETSRETGEMHYRSRTRGPWRKGETSGNTQRVVSMTPDCDGDAVLAVVEPRGPACHTGQFSCFGAGVSRPDAFGELDRIIASRAAALEASTSEEAQADRRPSYTQRLLTNRNVRLKKIGEEAAEFIAACADGKAKAAIGEAADLVYHLAVALHAVGASLDDVRRELAARAT